MFFKSLSHILSGCFKSHWLRDMGAGLNLTSWNEDDAVHWYIQYMQSICSARRNPSIIFTHPWYVDLCHYISLWLKFLHSDTIMPHQSAASNRLQSVICLLTPYFLLHVHLLQNDNQNSAINLLCHPILRGTAGLKLNFRGGKWI